MTIFRDISKWEPNIFAIFSQPPFHPYSPYTQNSYIEFFVHVAQSINTILKYYIYKQLTKQYMNKFFL